MSESQKEEDADAGLQSSDLATAALVFAHHIGIDINKEEGLIRIASEWLRELPDGWELGVAGEGEENAGIPYFFHTESESSVWEHPNEAVIMEKVKVERIRLQGERRVKVIQRKQSAAGQSPSKRHIDQTVNEIIDIKEVSHRIEESPIKTTHSVSSAQVASTGAKDSSTVDAGHVAVPVAVAAISSSSSSRDPSLDPPRYESPPRTPRKQLEVPSSSTRTAAITLPAILERDPFRGSERDRAQCLRDIILILTSDTREKENRDRNENEMEKEMDKIRTQLSNDSRLSILAASSKLLALCPTPGVTEDLRATVLALLSPAVRSSPVSVSLARAREVCVSFLSKMVLSSVAVAPSLSDAVQGKLLRLFLTARDTDNADSKEELPWQELMEFCYVSSVWAVLHSLLAARLMSEHQISLTEFRAVRALFSAFDDRLNGQMDALNLIPLLKDMNGEYDSEEASMILSAVDPWGTGTVPLGEFIRWWCSPSPGNVAVVRALP